MRIRLIRSIVDKAHPHSVVIKGTPVPTFKPFADDKCKILQNFTKNVKIVEFYYHIWHHHDKCIQISANMHSTGSVVR